MLQGKKSTGNSQTGGGSTKSHNLSYTKDTHFTLQSREEVDLLTRSLASKHVYGKLPSGVTIATGHGTLADQGTPAKHLTPAHAFHTSLDQTASPALKSTLQSKSKDQKHGLESFSKSKFGLSVTENVNSFEGKNEKPELVCQEGEEERQVEGW